MKEKFEKFKSKEISKAAAEKVIGGDGDIFDCIWECELKANIQCSIDYSDPGDIEFCVFQKSMLCISYCIDQDTL